jgi:hypothetical protein
MESGFYVPISPPESEYGKITGVFENSPNLYRLEKARTALMRMSLSRLVPANRLVKELGIQVLFVTLRLIEDF